MRGRRRLGLWLALGSASAMAGCAVGPDYQRPAAAVPADYKEIKGWKIAVPRDDLDKGDWWSIYHDPVLDGLERQVEIDNQTLKAAEAAYREAHAVVAEARAQLFPTLTADPSMTRTNATHWLRHDRGRRDLGARSLGPRSPHHRERRLGRAGERCRHRQCPIVGPGFARDRLFRIARSPIPCKTC